MKTNSIDTSNLKSLHTTVMIGMCTAIIAVLSQLSIPLPSGVPITLQTFAIALTGYLLGYKAGTIATVIYLLLGLIGAPVFSNFGSGVAVLFGKTGGFLIGFIFMSFLCGLAIGRKKKIQPVSVILLSGAGLLVCHLFGVLQFHFITNIGFWSSALLVSFPYLIKDIISVIIAYFVSVRIRKTVFS